MKMATRSERLRVIEEFRQYVLGNPALLAQVKSELRGKNLVCWCSPLPCHAEVLIELANST